MKKFNKIILSVLFITLAFLFTIINVDAKGISTSGDIITQKGSFNSTRFAFGKDVTNKADVNGLSFVAGEKVTLEGKAPYGFYAGNTVDVSEKVMNDAFIAGKNVTLTKDTLIGRDAFVAGSTVKVNSIIGRDLRIGGETVDLSGATIKGNVYVSAEKIILDKDTTVSGTLSYAKDSKVKGLNDASIKEINITKSDTVTNKEKSITDIILDRTISTIMSVLRVFIFMVVLMWLIPQLNEKLSKEEFTASNVAKKSLVGLGVLVVVPIVALIALFTGLLTSLALVGFAVYAVALYIASIFTYYIIGNYIDNKLIKKDNKYLSLLVGIVLIKLVEFIPVIGALVSLVVFLYGLGLVFNYINSIRKDKKKNTKTKKSK